MQVDACDLFPATSTRVERRYVHETPLQDPVLGRWDARSRSSPCARAAATSLCAPAVNGGEENAMRAWAYQCYGGPEVLQFASVAKPTPAADEVLVKVRAAGVNPLDWHYMRGMPYIMRMESRSWETRRIRGWASTLPGVVEAVGKDVTQFKPGDEVFGGETGAFAEYVRVARAARWC